jgi:hypothetical protein
MVWSRGLAVRGGVEPTMAFTGFNSVVACGNVSLDCATRHERRGSGQASVSEVPLEGSESRLVYRKSTYALGSASTHYLRVTLWPLRVSRDNSERERCDHERVGRMAWYSNMPRRNACTTGIPGCGVEVYVERGRRTMRVVRKRVARERCWQQHRTHEDWLGSWKSMRNQTVGR